MKQGEEEYGNLHVEKTHKNVQNNLSGVYYLHY